jgi:bifunctional DNA-binding transcriptional regulator/antitoxin component of YhaV-PrlF toxin-antitoxin module
MRLLGHTSREYKGKEYKKHWIVIPNSVVEKLGWKIGQDLEGEIKGEKLVIEKEDKKPDDDFKMKLR